MQHWTARAASDEAYELGEGPMWDAERSRLLWVDIQAGLVLVGGLVDGRVEVQDRHRFDSTVGAVAVAPDGAMVVAGTRTLLLVGPDAEIRGRLDLLDHTVASRLNDGACDPAGRFLIGTMALDDREGRERLLRLDDDLTVLDDDLTLSNGLGFAPDGRTLYSVDSEPGRVWARTYDPDDGAVGRRELLLDTGDDTPDGLCVDAEGHLWIAMWGAGEVRRYTPSGETVGRVEVPVPNPTSVAFVGPDLGTLLITTARHGLEADERAAAPASGRLFLAEVGVVGAPVSAWDGSWPDER
jgi:sugar lactone lactonase YvrE